MSQVLLLFLGVVGWGLPQEAPSSPRSPTIQALNEQVRSARAAAVDDFWRTVEARGTPLIERLPDVPDSLLLTLLWRGDDRTRNVAVVGGVAGWVPAQNVMRQVSGSDVWYRSYVISGDARFTYFLSPNDPLDGGAPLARIADLRTDPWNPDSIAYTRTRSVSTYEGPDAPAQRWSFRRSAAAPGRVERRTFVSSVLGNERFVWLYTPPGWVSGAECGLLVLLDGHDYVTYTDTPAILDNLMDSGKVPCLAAVMVGNAEGQRGIELPPNERFSDFIVQELVPWAKQSLGVTPPPSMTVIAGSSYGGLAAAWLGFRHPEVFGNVLAQSGSFWWSPQNDAEPEWLTRQFAAAPLLPVRFHLDIGLMESRSRNPLVPTMLTVNRHMRDVLSAKGYLVHYVEFNGGHEHLNWRGTLAEGLLDLMGRPK